MRLPDCVSDSPECSQNEKAVTVLRVRYPVEEDADGNDVHPCSDDEDGNTTYNSDECSKEQGKDGIEQSVRDHHVTHIVNTPSTGYVSL